MPAKSGEIERWASIADEAIDALVADGLIGADLVAEVRDYLESYRNRQ